MRPKEPWPSDGEPSTNEPMVARLPARAIVSEGSSMRAAPRGLAAVGAGLEVLPLAPLPLPLSGSPPADLSQPITAWKVLGSCCWLMVEGARPGEVDGPASPSGSATCILNLDAVGSLLTRLVVRSSSSGAPPPAAGGLGSWSASIPIASFLLPFAAMTTVCSDGVNSSPDS